MNKIQLNPITCKPLNPFCIIKIMAIPQNPTDKVYNHDSKANLLSLLIKYSKNFLNFFTFLEGLSLQILVIINAPARIQTISIAKTIPNQVPLKLNK